MPSTPPDLLARLLKDVERTSGMEITCTRDCEVLSEELRAFDGRFPVSVSTLRRCFGLIEAKGSFSQTTLNTLARYVGHPSFRAWSSNLHDSGTAVSSRNLAQFSGLGKVNLSPEASATSPQPTEMPTARRGADDVMPKSAVEAQAIVESFIHRFVDPKQFHLSPKEFSILKAAVFDIYERGNFDVAQWMQVVSHEHLLRFVVEQFPPLDFMNTFGWPMVEAFNEVFRAPSDAMYGHGLLASGLVARDEPWSRVGNHLPELNALNPGIHPLVQARAIGIQLLAAQEGNSRESRWEQAKSLALQGLREDKNIWPRWAHQNCYFAFNLADWAVLSGDREIIEAVSGNIQAFRAQQDWYNRSGVIETILSIRQVWNWISLDRKDDALQLMESVEWPILHSFEVRTLGMWYHAASLVLGLAPKELCEANLWYAVNLTGYAGFGRRIQELVEHHGLGQKK